MPLRDAERDLLEAGARDAAEAILRLAQRESARILSVDVEPLSALVARLAPRAVVVGFVVSGGVQGRFALVLTEPAARVIAQAMVGGRHTLVPSEKLGKRLTGALTELGNIAASAFMNGVAELVHQSCVPSVPAFGHGDAAEVLPAALGDALEVQVARLIIGEVEVELAFAR
ncbi:MAG: hypothetical protein IT383_18280 [Deltaproteobacteria bacterium]|nr:hypothetical protein [Deltaproteobacteria bacterium]